MIEVEFAPTDYRRIRFAFSSVGEASKSLRVQYTVVPHPVLALRTDRTT